MIPEILQDPQIQHRQMVRHVSHPAAGTVPQVVSPMRFQESELSFETAPPMLGQHTEAILRELGLERAQIDALKARGAV
jgi:crotonobetainyl-CoA:carnitine CoA-transferase CaiB-like acyl-CoA transferase